MVVWVSELKNWWAWVYEIAIEHGALMHIL